MSRAPQQLLDALLEATVLCEAPVRLEVSRVAPWFGQSGGGVQYRFLDAEDKPLPNWKLKERDILTQVPRD